MTYPKEILNVQNVIMKTIEISMQVLILDEGIRIAFTKGLIKV